MESSKTFLITGVSSGLGEAFADAALAAGHRVVGTLRSQRAADAFAARVHGKSYGVVLDVTDFAAVPGAVAAAQRDAGPIDVLINNAGYGLEGILEETPLEDVRRQFDANVFGAVALMQAVLPAMRERRSGRIVNVTSMGGFITMPGISAYCGSKFALEGISESLAAEVRPLGIYVTALAPGQFRTQWAGRSMQRAARAIRGRRGRRPIWSRAHPTRTIRGCDRDPRSRSRFPRSRNRPGGCHGVPRAAR